MSELLKLLDDSAEATVSATSYTFTPTSYGTRVKFSDNPYSSALIFQSSSSYITINGNEESCGSSFSESESSVMASVDMGGISNANAKPGCALDGIREWLEAEDGGACEGQVRGSEWEWYEEQLAKFLAA
ncbi:Polyamine oxidase 5 [Hibiscus syriacus]|uniref:Polyamine oxidase 5 n=2 Tax=Hibiscus syriacus TaxID=106335 RepID=A0A6A3ANW9_HIBSY|nr:Polyamine oxidase 5 [Hibiscus syriacus]